MLTAYNRSQFIEKTITDAQGRQFKAVFFVTLEAGEVRARLVSLKALAPTILALKGTVIGGPLCLSGHCAPRPIESPYFSLLTPSSYVPFDLDFFLSTQPTRAPSYA